jgi:hypothetical protein
MKRKVKRNLRIVFKEMRKLENRLIITEILNAWDSLLKKFNMGDK